MSISKRLCGVAGAFAALAAVTPVWAADMVKAPDVAAQATMMNKGDVAWMLLSAVLVLMMAIPGLALFYGGLVRTKNMLSVLMQVFMIVAVRGAVWCGWGYSMAFTSGGDPLLRRPFQGFPRRRDQRHLCRDLQQQRLSAGAGVRDLPDDLRHASRPR
ncbi:MAG: hypothetical protein LKM31_11300 [Sphingobium sp.]|jgi:hypothetical protein|nr:hypothetical protein [Sphingobium sp.]